MPKIRRLIINLIVWTVSLAYWAMVVHQIVTALRS